MKTVNSIKLAVIEIEWLMDVFEYGSHYFILEHEGKKYQIRVSDHAANANNNQGWAVDGYLSFIKKWNRQEKNMEFGEFLVKDGMCYEYDRTIENMLELELS